MQNVLKDLDELFSEARTRNEFEFVLVLINYRGLGTQKLTTNLHEWFEAIESYKNLYDGTGAKDKTRMAMMLYSTFFENSDFYNIIGSLCRVKLGYRGSSYLFWKTKKYERLLGVNEKQEFLLDLLFDTDKHHIIKFFSETHFKGIRNAYFHSAYSISDEEVILHESEPILINGMGQFSFNIEAWFYPIVENVYQFFAKFRQLYLDSFMLFTHDKEINTSTSGFETVEILGTKDGLMGFKHKNAVQFYGEWHDSGIWYNPKTDMWEGHNIRFSGENLETIQIDEQLSRYEQKVDIRISDADFLNLIGKVIERNVEEEIYRATKLLIKFGETKWQKMESEDNPYRKKSFANVILPFYYRALEIGSQFINVAEIQNKILALETIQQPVK